MQATERAVAGFAYQPPAPRHDEFAQSARLLVQAVDDCCGDRAGVPADSPAHAADAEAWRVLGDGVIDAVLRRPLAPLSSERNLRPMLEQLRRRFVRLALDATPQLGGRAVARVLDGFERVQARIDADPTQRFAGQLSDPAMELVVAVAHDMRSPLSSIFFLVDALRSGMSGPVTQQQQQQLQIVYSAVFGLSSLTGDVIALAREGERLSQEPACPMSLSECFQSVGNILQPIAEQKKLRLELLAPLPDFRIGRPMLLARVLLNLVSNALKYTDAGGVRVEARDVSRTQVEFSVTDTGRGIPPDAVATLFDAFRAGRAGSRAFSSGGLGLALCVKLLRAIGSELHVEPRQGGGTRFHFRLALPVAPRV